MKRNNTRAALISLFLGLAVVTSGQAEYYYVYQTPNGALVISNSPPPGSKITKQLNLPEDPQAQELVKPQPNVPPEGTSKASKSK